MDKGETVSRREHGLGGGENTVSSRGVKGERAGSPEESSIREEARASRASINRRIKEEWGGEKSQEHKKMLKATSTVVKKGEKGQKVRPLARGGRER